MNCWFVWLYSSSSISNETFLSSSLGEVVVSLLIYLKALVMNWECQWCFHGCFWILLVVSILTMMMMIIAMMMLLFVVDVFVAPLSKIQKYFFSLVLVFSLVSSQWWAYRRCFSKDPLLLLWSSNIDIFESKLTNS